MPLPPRHEPHAPRQYRVIETLDPGWIASQAAAAPLLHAFAVWDRERFPERVSFRVLERDGTPLGYLLIWNGSPGHQVVHWVGPTEESGPLLDALPDPPFVAVVPDELAPEVLARRGPGRARGLQLRRCEVPVTPEGSARRLHFADTPALERFCVRSTEPRFAHLVEGYRGLDIAREVVAGSFEGPELAAVARAQVHLPQVWLLTGVVTSPEFRGRGHARAVTALLTHLAQEEGAVPGLYVQDGNAPAEAVYTRLGYRTIAHRMWIELGIPTTA
ncbi:MAG: GNAT family N-acetyltransferase [Thermoplasmata archaeon]|nr:GNAT family N-acetyltransferase [Thermoplasmata archaeon]